MDSPRAVDAERPGGAGIILSPVQLDLPFNTGSRLQAAEAVDFVRVRTARRYILRVRPDGTLRVTIPRGGSRAQAVAFLDRHTDWVARERSRVADERAPVMWTHGSTILLAGEPHVIRLERRAGRLVARYADRTIAVTAWQDVRPEIERDLRALAAEQLVPRLRELAVQHGLTIRRVTIRNQRSRWGSCSRSGAIALNFRLVQMPPAIADYVLIHELMHLKEQNHGRRFWSLVARVCPGYRDAEAWLRGCGRGLF
jgi:predicted metal-dependent hydrolase